MPRNKVAWRRLVFVALIIVALALLTVSFRETSSGPIHSIQQAGLSALTPLQSAGARAAKPFRDGYHWVTTLWSAHRENQQLAGQLEKLQGVAVQNQELGQENDRLRGLLDFQDSTVFPAGASSKVAMVIGKAPTLWESWVLIDKGSADGVEVDQAVVGATPVTGNTQLSGKGLVGKVVSVTAHSAKIQLITDSESSVAAIIEGPRAEGIVQGSVSGDITMDYVDRDQIVDPKRVIVTSGAGGVYPKGIPIGIVANVGDEDVNTYKLIQVEPFVDFRVLEEVMVITGVTDVAGTTTTTGVTSVFGSGNADGTGGIGNVTGTTGAAATTGGSTSTTPTTAFLGNTSTTKGR
jgi:rod shape-determining protein MreC